MTDYSKRTLTRKLGYKAGQKILVLKAPGHYWNLLPDLPEEIDIHRRRGKGLYDFVHLFFQHEKDFLNQIKDIHSIMDPKASLWISWPKKSSVLESDLNRDSIRAYLLKNTPLVDCKVAAIDDDWSGLKFMVRKIHR